MKTTLLCFLSVCVLASARAQNFYLTPDTAWASGDTSVSLLNCYSHIYNTSNDTLWLKWKRTSQSMPAGWSASVCDELLCYPPSVDSGSVSVLPNDSSLLAVQYYTLGQQGTGVIHVVVYDALDSVNTSVKTVYIGTITISSVMEALADGFSIYPNPTGGSFQITTWLMRGGPAYVGIYDMHMRKVMEWTWPTGSPEQRIVLPEGIPAGVYQVILVGDGHRATRKLVVSRGD